MGRRILDIGIAGAGPAGLAVALYLTRAGHKVRMFERFEQPAPVGSGLILQQFLAAMVSGTLVDPFKPIGLGEADWAGLAKQVVAQIPA